MASSVKIEGPIIDVEYKEILPDGSVYSELYEVNKYACDLLRKFNETNRTWFSCNLGLSDSYIIQSKLDKNGQISLVIPRKCMPDGHNKVRVEAMKLLVTAELSRNLYKGLTISSLDKLATAADKLANIYRRLVMSASMCIAADLHAQRLYTSMGNKMTEALYEAYMQMIKEGKRESEKTIPYYLNKGILPPTYRLKYMKHYKNFSANNYEILNEIIRDLSRLSLKYMNKRLGLMEYEKWIRVQMEFDKFPNRINRLRR